MRELFDARGVFIVVRGGWLLPDRGDPWFAAIVGASGTSVAMAAWLRTRAVLARAA